MGCIILGYTLNKDKLMKLEEDLNIKKKHYKVTCPTSLLNFSPSRIIKSANNTLKYPVSEVRYPGRGKGGMEIVRRFTFDDLADGELTDPDTLRALDIMHKRASVFSRLWKIVKNAFGHISTEEESDNEDAKIAVMVDPSFEPVVRTRATVPVHITTKDRIKEWQQEGEPLVEVMDRVVGMAEMWEMNRKGFSVFGGKKKKPGDSGMGGLLGDMFIPEMDHIFENEL